MPQHRTSSLSALCFAIGAWLIAASASADSAPKSSVELAFLPRAVHAELRLPVDTLAAVIPRDLSPTSSSTDAAAHGLSDYLEAHIHAQAPDGSPWSVRATSLSLRTLGNTRYLVADVVLRPPAAMPARVLRLDYDVITRENPSHTVLVSIASDWGNGVFADQPVLIAVLHGALATVPIDRSGGGVWHGLVGMVKHEITHLAEGTDHRIALEAFGVRGGIAVLPLTVLVLLMPWFIVRRDPAFSGVRMGGAILAAAAGLGWILERAWKRVGPMAPVVQIVPQHAPWMVAALAVFGLLGLLFKRRSGRPPDATPAPPTTAARP